MKIKWIPLVISLAIAFSSPVVLGQTLSDLKGKWSLKKKSEQFGEEVTQTVEFKDDTFTYRVQAKSGDTVLYAKGKVKLEKLGPFKVAKLTEIQGGYSESNLQPTNDDRTIIYTTGYNSLTMALNFDMDRDGEKPVADTYTKAP